MQPDRSIYETLLQRYLCDDINVAETHVLFDYIAADPGLAEELLNKDNYKAFEEKLNADPALPESISVRMHRRLLEDIEKEISRENTTVKPSIYKRLSLNYKWRIAAALIPLLAIGTYLWFQVNEPRKESDSGISQLPVDILPGKNGAILTLADGAKVILDSLGNGVVATQSGTVIILENGELAYGPMPGSDQEIVYNTMTTPNGRQFLVTLSDGTKVWLNAASSLRYPAVFAGKERNVEVTGEAYFEVAENAEKPFIIKLNDQTQIEVLGTKFNVNAYSDEASINTTLLSGSVRVVTDANNSVVLKPGQQAQVFSGKTASRVLVVPEVNTDQIVAWKNGSFNFNDKTLRDVMRQLARWYDMEVVYDGNVPDKIFFGEMGRDLNLSQCLNVLERMEVHFRIEGRKLIVMQ